MRQKATTLENMEHPPATIRHSHSPHHYCCLALPLSTNPLTTQFDAPPFSTLHLPRNVSEFPRP